MAEASSKKRMIVPNQSSSVAEVQSLILHELEVHGFAEKQIFGIRLALEEALTNAIHHGNCGDPKKKVEVEYEVTDQRLWVSITDEGCGFTPEQLPDPTLDENLTKPGGRGVLLMRAYMDDVQFSPAGNRVILTKTRD